MRRKRSRRGAASPDSRVAQEYVEAAPAMLTLEAFSGLSVLVAFSKSNRSATWDSSRGSLLELAESLGIEPRYGCRSGMCGACEVRIVAGDVEYLRPTLAEPKAGSALICKAVPKRPLDASNPSSPGFLALDV